MTGLTPGTLYHFRVVATNSAATTDGADTTFQTLVSFLVQVGSFGSPGSARRPVPDPDRGGGRSAAARCTSPTARTRAIQRFNKKGSLQGGLGVGRQGRPGEERGLQEQEGVPGGHPRLGRRPVPESHERRGRQLQEQVERQRVRRRRRQQRGPEVQLGGQVPVDDRRQHRHAGPFRRASRAWPSTRTATCGPPMSPPATSTQFDSSGTFVQEWNDPSGAPAGDRGRFDTTAPST